MKSNVGSIDKILRIVVGLALIALSVFAPHVIGYWGYLGIIPLVTGLFNFCPAYTLLGINTKGKTQE